MIASFPVTSSPAPTSEDISNGLKTAAKLARKYGDAYLPFFAHLEAELQIATEREALLQRINAILSD